MSTKQLSYESLKTVLLYMEANLRTRLSTRLPEIRCAERATPLQIDRLAFAPDVTVVNGITYRLGVYRDFHDKEINIPYDVQRDNEEGGGQQEFDKWGFMIRESGDYTDREEEQYKATVMQYENELKQLLQIEETDEGEEEEEEEEEEEDDQQIDGAISNAKYHIDLFRFLLIPFDCRRKNIPPPWTCYLKLTIKGPNGTQIHRMPYRISLKEARKKLHDSLFGRRRFPVSAKKLEVSSTLESLHLPIGFKVKTNHLGVHFACLTEVEQIMTESCFPLKVVSVKPPRKREEIEVMLQNKIIRNAEKLEIDEFFYLFSMWRPIIQQLPHKKIHMIFETMEGASLEYIRFIEHLIETPKEVGYSYEFGIRLEESAENFMRLVKKYMEVEEPEDTDDGSIAIPRESGTRLHISYKPTECLPERTGDLYYDNLKSNFVMTMKVVAGNKESR